MVLHLPHAEGGYGHFAEGGYGVTFNDITKDGVLYRYITLCGLVWPFSQERQGLWLPKDDLRDSSSSS